MQEKLENLLFLSKTVSRCRNNLTKTKNYKKSWPNSKSYAHCEAQALTPRQLATQTAD
jgi:hypothetical protein